MKQVIYLLAAITLASCGSAPKIAVPEKFMEVSEKMHIKGVNGFVLNQKLSFGDYQTTKVKRGWTSTTERTRHTVEQRLLQIFTTVDPYNSTTRQKNRYRYSIGDGKSELQVFCQERMSRDELNIRTNNKILGDLSTTRRSEYTFSAALIPESDTAAPWRLLLYSVYDREKDTARRIFDLPYKEQEGYVTDGRETIIIKPLRLKNMVTRKGKEAQIPFKVLSGYELRIDDGVIAVIDSLGKTCGCIKNWMQIPKGLLPAFVLRYC